MYKSLLPLLLFLFSIGLTGQSIESKLQSAIDSIYKEHPNSVGIMVHVESPEKNISWSVASGYSNKETKSKLEADSPALIASSIKTYVSASILKLVENGQLDINNSIGDHLSKKTSNLLKKDNYNLDEIKIKHLLSHTSGLFNYADAAYIEDKNKNPNYRWTRDEQIALSIKKGDPIGKAGEQFNYADVNYLLLTEIIEQKTGESFYDAMKKLLEYDKLGIKNTWFPTLEDRPSNTKELVHQYWGKYNWDSYNLDPSWDLYGGGGIACPTKDLALFIQNYFNGNIVENKSIQNQIFTYIPTPETETHPYYLGLQESNYYGMKGYGHGGFWGTTMSYFPAINTSISIYILERDENKLRKNVMESVSKIIQKEYSKRLQSYSGTTSKDNAQKSDLEQIRETLFKYIDGTANGEPQKLREAFHPDFNLFTVTDQDSLLIRSGEKYMANVKQGKKSNRVGRIISIDYENTAATAKVEIEMPGWRVYTDYFLLLKYEGSWKIVHKSYSWRTYLEE